MAIGYELKATPGRGEGVFSTKSYSIGEIVMVGVIEKELKANHSHASEVSASRHVQHGGLISKVNHSCSPSCGISVNESALMISLPSGVSTKAKKSHSITT